MSFFASAEGVKVPVRISPLACAGIGDLVSAIIALYNRNAGSSDQDGIPGASQR